MATVIAWIGLIGAVAALAYAWKLSHELETARRRLDRYNKALFDVNDEVRELREKLAESTARLGVEVMHRTGTPAFTPDMTVRQTQMLHPQAGEVLAAFHLGGCSSCAVEPDDTLAAVCAQSGVEAAQVLVNLNALLGTVQVNGVNGDGVNGDGVNGHAQPFTPSPVKLPNVEFEF